ncbi:MAG: MaoC/PaaZ C-terminal domain-containing protein [Acidimicrobiales bacterium]
MPIDVAKVNGAELTKSESSWEVDDVILYHLGVGAGVPPTAEGELEYTYEGKLKVLPSFAVTPAFGAIASVIMADGMSINPMMVLHGEQAITVHKPLPTSAEVSTTAKVTDIFDKGKGAAIVVEAETTDTDGDGLFTNRFVIFARGEGGFGGPSGPPPGNQAPERTPDLQVESPTLEQQALLYRLSGDKNPLHADPAFAAMGGFDRPILHGLCSYGIVCKAVVDHALDGDVTKVAGYAARFAGTVFPGETIVTSIWNEGGQLIISAACKERGTPVISNSVITLRGGK